MKILITGGAGYIGSTIASALEDSGHTPVILDSLVTGRLEFTRGRAFYKGDIADRALVMQVFSEHPDIFAVIHCAALIVVPESTVKPYEYYRENVGKSLELFNTLKEVGSKRLVFSSSASIYDVVPGFMVTEAAPLNPTSPYARTKFMMEMILRDFCAAYGSRGIALRYFNPIGADPQMRSGLQLERPPMPLAVWWMSSSAGCLSSPSPAPITPRAMAPASAIMFTSGIWRGRMCARLKILTPLSKKQAVRRTTIWSSTWAPGAA